MKYHDHNAKDDLPFLDALTKTRDIAVREGRCYQPFRQSSWRSTNMQKRPRVIGSIFRASRTRLADVASRLEGLAPFRSRFPNPFS